MNHDTSYHALFSNPELVEDLLLNFVDEDFIRQFNFATLRRENTKLLSRTLKKRESDIIYSLETKDGLSTYLYLFLEFQSSADKWMPVRIAAYISLFYQQLEKEKRLTHRGLLPPVFALVLYNGKSTWRYATTLRHLIDLPPRHPLWKYQIDAHFYLIDETLFPAGRPDSLTGLLFRLENATTDDDTIDALLELAALLRQSDASPGVKRAFNEWVRYVLEPHRQIELQLEHIENLAEHRAMLKERVEQWRKEAETKGLQKGREEGRLEGRRTTLKKLAMLKFQTLPPWAAERIDSAAEAELDEWTARILTMSRIEDVLAT